MSASSEAMFTALRDALSTALLAHLRELPFSTHHILSVNFSGTAQAQLLQLYPRANLTHIPTGNLALPAIPNETLDFVIAIIPGTAEQVLRDMLPDMKRVLKNTGLFLFATPATNNQTVISALHELQLISLTTLSVPLNLKNTTLSVKDGTLYFVAKTEIPELRDIQSYRVTTPALVDTTETPPQPTQDTPKKPVTTDDDDDDDTDALESLDTLADQLEENNRLLNEQRASLAKLDSSALMLAKLQGHTPPHQYIDMLETYRELHETHKNLLDTFITAHATQLETQPELDKRYHEIIARHQDLLADHSEEIATHEENLRMKPGQ